MFVDRRLFGSMSLTQRARHTHDTPGKACKFKSPSCHTIDGRIGIDISGGHDPPSCARTCPVDENRFVCARGISAPLSILGKSRRPPLGTVTQSTRYSQGARERAIKPSSADKIGCATPLGSPSQACSRAVRGRDHRGAWAHQSARARESRIGTRQPDCAYGIGNFAQSEASLRRSALWSLATIIAVSTVSSPSADGRSHRRRIALTRPNKPSPTADLSERNVLPRSQSVPWSKSFFILRRAIRPRCSAIATQYPVSLAALFQTSERCSVHAICRAYRRLLRQRNGRDRDRPVENGNPPPNADFSAAAPASSTLRWNVSIGGNYRRSPEPIGDVAPTEVHLIS